MAHWLQHTSRDGDMQLHVHSQIAHVARTGTDGKWRAPDSLGYAEHDGAVAAHARDPAVVLVLKESSAATQTPKPLTSAIGELASRPGTRPADHC